MTFSEAKTMLEDYKKHNLKLKEIDDQIEVFRAYMEPGAAVITGMPKSKARADPMLDNLIRIFELQKKARQLKRENMGLMIEVERRLLLMDPPYSTVLAARYRDGLTIEAVAEFMDKSDRAVKNYSYIGVEMFSDFI